MTFEQLYYFTEVYRLNSITKAAENLYVSRTTVSIAIKKLETELDVLLFCRLPNGVIPTQAGEEVYKSAQIILEENAVLKCNIKKYSQLPYAVNSMKIGFTEGLINVFGDEIASKLISIYPHIHYDFSQIIPQASPDFFKGFDLSIILSSETVHKNRSSLLNNDYSITHLATIPMYVWISNSSQLQKSSIITIDMLKDIPFCSLKNTYSGINYAQFLEKTYNATNSKPNIDLTSSFIQHIEQLGYYTIDFPINKSSKLFYEDIFQDKAITLKKTDFSFMLQLIFRKEKFENYKAFLPLITDILLSKL